MSDPSKTSDAAGAGQSGTMSELLPLVYEALRKAARNQMAREAPNHSLQATALVHEAYLRLTRSEKERHWDGPAHFYAAITEVMRRILVENARRKKRLKRGGGMARHHVDPNSIRAPECDDDVLVLDEALTELAARDPAWAELVKLRYFMGMTVPEAARVLGVSARTADSWWADARAWLRQRLAVDIGEAFSQTPPDAPARGVRGSPPPGPGGE